MGLPHQHLYRKGSRWWVPYAIMAPFALFAVASHLAILAKLYGD